jgi:hypothetical protein
MNSDDPSPFEDGTGPAGLRRALEASAPDRPLPDLVRERIRHSALTARRHRRQRILAFAASVTLLISALPLLTRTGPASAVQEPFDHPLLQDPLLTELDLLDLHLLELTRHFDSDFFYPLPEDLL